MFRLIFNNCCLLLVLICFSAPVLAEQGQIIDQLISSARSQIGQTTGYDGSYQKLDYPGGDVPLATGVCTDVVIRAYRSVGYDLQELLHLDIRKYFELYPSSRNWGSVKPDRNIDHRRVPNLMVFFKRHGTQLPVTETMRKLEPGDLLTWRLPSGVPHIGIVSDRKSADGARLLVIHNIGNGAQEEDLIAAFELTGHFRYQPWLKNQ